MFGIISSTTLLVDGQYNSNTGLKRQSSAFFWPNHAKLSAIRTQKSYDLLQIHSNFSQFNSNLNSTTFFPNITFSLLFFQTCPPQFRAFLRFVIPTWRVHFLSETYGLRVASLSIWKHYIFNWNLRYTDIPLNYSNSHHKHKEMWLCGSPMQSLEKKINNTLNI